jgi:hypothetical protein
MLFMKPVMLLLLSGAIQVQVHAQKSETFTVQAGDDATKVLAYKDIYQYPAFAAGRAFFKDGTSGTGRFNYNKLLDEMQFIDPKGDTLSMAGESTIRFIAVGADSFYYNKGYMKSVKTYPQVQLLKKTFLKELDKKKIGAYGSVSSTSAIDSYESFVADNTVYKLTVRGDVLFSQKTEYYLGGKNHTFLPANKRSAIKLFPKHEGAINRYLGNHPVDFRKEQDLLQLTQFLQSLAG